VKISNKKISFFPSLNQYFPHMWQVKKEHFEQLFSNFLLQVLKSVQPNNKKRLSQTESNVKVVLANRFSNTWSKNQFFY
jgi:hypothetical protein